jgi:hypothetical protein
MGFSRKVVKKTKPELSKAFDEIEDAICQK